MISACVGLRRWLSERPRRARWPGLNRRNPLPAYLNGEEVEEIVSYSFDLTYVVNPPPSDGWSGCGLTLKLLLVQPH